MGKYVSLKDIAIKTPHLLQGLINNDSLIVCRNRINRSLRTERFAVLYGSHAHFWEINGEWDYFVRKDFLRSLVSSETNRLQSNMEKDVKEVLGKQFEEVSMLSPEDRNKKLEHSIEQVEKVLHKKKASSKEISETLVESSIYSALINKVTLEDIMNKDDAESKHHALKISQKTESLMDNLIEIISRDFDFDDALTALNESTGGNTLKHMTRVFIHTMRFMDFINSQIEYSGLNTWIIGRFNNYRKLYQPLFPSVKGKEMNMHKIIMEPIKLGEELYRDISLGMMLHDIGKKKNISYFEGNETYQRDLIEGHAFDGYFMIMRRSIYKEEVAAMAGMHHEYYGSPTGYGIYRENLEERGLSLHDPGQFNGIMTTDYRNIKSFKAMAYLPAKILEIIDVYDALIDPAREYKKALPQVEALKIMKEQMILEDLKLDPILFDLFVKYLRKSQSTGKA